jgi:hypothetical protein
MHSPDAMKLKASGTPTTLLAMHPLRNNDFSAQLRKFGKNADAVQPAVTASDPFVCGCWTTILSLIDVASAMRRSTPELGKRLA